VRLRGHASAVRTLLQVLSGPCDNRDSLAGLMVLGRIPRDSVLQAVRKVINLPLSLGRLPTHVNEGIHEEAKSYENCPDTCGYQGGAEKLNPRGGRTRGGAHPEESPSHPAEAV